MTISTVPGDVTYIIHLLSLDLLLKIEDGLNVFLVNVVSLKDLVTKNFISGT